MPYEDFTTYTEVEPDDRIQKTATHVDAELHRDEDAYLYKDKGAGHFTDFEHKIDVKLVSSDVAGWGGVWGLSQNTVDDWKGWATGDIAVLFWTGAGPVYNLKLEERGVGADGYICAVNTMYYLTIKKVGTSLTCKIYSDSARTNLLDTLSRTITDNSYRYIYACLTTNSPAAMIANVDVENLDLQEVVEKEVTDSGVGAETVTRPERKMSLSDQATGQETFSRPERKMTLSEVATTLESILKTRGVAPLLDSGIGAETITRPERTMTITELASGLEAILKVRNLAAILDSALGVEAISRPKRDITLIESAAGLETILKTRNLIVLDSAVGAETVIKAVIGEVLKLVTDSATGSEVIKRLERSMVISEFATGVEQILKTRHLSITDLASGLDQILKTRILPTITDTAVGSESILKERRLLILDAGLGAEQIFRPERYISISDLAQGIEEILKTRNVAAIIDTATGEELVTAIKPGVSPTKLFLIIGNIAIQLTGD